MLRLPAVRLAGLLLGAAALAGGAWLAFRTPEPRRPHIVVVVWDTCRADRLSAYGHPVDTTPWLKRFAAEGVLYGNAFTPSPWTPPAHASLFTGLLPIRHGLKQGLGDRVAPGLPLLAETLRSAGYATVGFSANGFISPATGLDAGFERMTPLYDAGWGVGRADRVLGEVERWLAERRGAPEAEREKPLFLFVNFMDMHLPRLPPPEDILAVTGPGSPPPQDVMKALSIDQREAAAHLLGITPVDARTVAGMATIYDASARFLDRHTGLLMERLRAEGILEGAVSVVVSDHGEHLGEHGNLSHEMSLHDEVLRIPMVVRWPGRLEGGRVETAQVRLQDLYPTLLEAARVPTPANTGRDALSLTEAPLSARLWKGAFHRPTAFLPEAAEAFAGVSQIHFEKFHVSIHGVQDSERPGGPIKFLLHARGREDGHPVTVKEELFDLGADPRERKDLLQDPSPEALAEAARLRALIER